MTTNAELEELLAERLREQARLGLMNLPPEFEIVGYSEAADRIETLAAEVVLLREALRGIVWFCDDPNGSDNPETLAVGLSRLLVPARAALAASQPDHDGIIVVDEADFTAQDKP